MRKIRRLVWIHPHRMSNGGGERLILEGLKSFEAGGIETTLLVSVAPETEVYDGVYKPRVVALDTESGGFPGRLIRRIVPMVDTAIRLRRKLWELRPDMIIMQAQWGEAIPLYIATLFTPFSYAAYVFDSLFAYVGEQSRHALVFRKHFAEVRRSVAAYQEIVAPHPAGMGIRRRLSLEMSVYLRYLSIRKARSVLVFSSQNRWEVGKLYGRSALAAKAAFSPSIFAHKTGRNIKEKLGIADKRMLLSICRLHQKKRVDLVLRAFKVLSQEADDAVLIIGGDGQQKEALMLLTGELGLDERVRFVGYVKEDELWDFYAAADLFVHMDLADFDIAPYEALALGKKVIWSTEMEEEPTLSANGLLFPADPSIEGVANAMERALATDPPRNAAANRALLSEYTWDKYFDRILAELENAIT